MKGFAQKIAVYSGIVVALALLVGSSTFLYRRYFNYNLTQIPLLDEEGSGASHSGEDISFTQLEGTMYDVSTSISNGDSTAIVNLRNIDLGLFIPKMPDAIQGNEDLERWFLTEREFNRQRVIFSADSPHIELETGNGLDEKNISVHLTNNCLGFGYWEVAVYAEQDGNEEAIYKGFFKFPGGHYRQLVEEANGISYWQYARNMEAWPGFRFNSGDYFDLDAVRTVEAEYDVLADYPKDDPILTLGEQEKKANLVVHNDADNPLRTWADIKQSDIQFQSFVAPGIYADSTLWGSDFSKIANFTGAVTRDISSNLSGESLQEIELAFQSMDGETHRLILSGLDLQDIPQLSNEQYSDGIYMPIGFGTPFTQDYEELKQNPPSETSFISVVLDDNNQVVDYRRDIGINGVVIHRDEFDADVVHVYPMSYERIMLVGHYVVDVDRSSLAASR